MFFQHRSYRNIEPKREVLRWSVTTLMVICALIGLAWHFSGALIVSLPIQYVIFMLFFPILFGVILFSFARRMAVLIEENDEDAL